MSGPLLKTTLGTVIFIDVLRIFLPSLITIFGSAGDTPAELIGVYALSWFLAAYLAVGVARLFGARHTPVHRRRQAAALRGERGVGRRPVVAGRHRHTG
jgi:Kef-type K+ transport system membrane component KefB